MKELKVYQRSKIALMLLVSLFAYGGHVSAMAAVDVQTDADLKVYAAGAVEEDRNLEGMSFRPSEVEVRYKERGHILALIPVTFKARAVARAGGGVDLVYPWYSFITIDKQGEIESQIKTAVDIALEARAVGSVRGGGEVRNPVFTASQSAAVAAGMQKVLKSVLDTTADVQVQ